MFATIQRKVIALACAAALAVICSGGTAAYFTSRSRATEVFTIGRVSIEVIEPSWKQNEKHPIIAGNSYAKDPQVANTGTTAAYVRMRVKFSDYQAFLASGVDPTSMYSVSSDWVATGTPEVDGDTITYRYAYTKRLAAQEKTSALFSSITIPTGVTETTVADMGGSFDVSVGADAIQAEGFASYADALAAFDQQMGA